MNNGNNYIPMYARPGEGRKPSPSEVIAERKATFAMLNDWLRARGGGWLVSVPGDRTVLIEVLEGSSLPEELRNAGRVLTSHGESERIVHSVTEKFVRAPSGELVPLTWGSTLPVGAIETKHAGIVTVLRFGFELP